MKRSLDEGTARAIFKTLLERFGEPIGKAIDLSVSDKPKRRKAKTVKPSVIESIQACIFCGSIPTQLNEGMCCDQCGMMTGMEETEVSGRHPGHATSCTCPDCSRQEQEIDEKAPPGREKQVKALKKNKDVDNAWAVAWASYNKSH